MSKQVLQLNRKLLRVILPRLAIILVSIHETRIGVIGVRGLEHGTIEKNNVAFEGFFFFVRSDIAINLKLLKVSNLNDK